MIRLRFLVAVVALLTLCRVAWAGIAHLAALIDTDDAALRFTLAALASIVYLVHYATTITPAE